MKAFNVVAFEVKSFSLWLVFKTLKIFNTESKTISSKYTFHCHRHHIHEPGLVLATHHFWFGSVQGKLMFHIWYPTV